MAQKLFANYHTHTKRCHHASGEDREYVIAAIEAGIKILGFSDHVPWPGHVPGVERSRMTMLQLDEYFTSLIALREEFRSQIEIHIGFEVENFDLLDENLKTLEQYPCEYLILGHHFSSYGEDAHYFGRPFDDPALLQIYTERTLHGIESGRFLYLAHPDMPDFQGDPALLEDAWAQICEAAKKQDLPLEVNMLGMRTGRNYPTERFFRMAAENGNRFCIGVDAHSPAHFAEPEVLEQAVSFAEQFGAPVQYEFML